MKKANEILSYHLLVTITYLAIYIFKEEVAFLLLVRAMLWLDSYGWQGYTCRNFKFWLNFVIPKSD